MSSGNSDGWPDGGLPELPPDWGPIVVPDDPAELAAEAALVRRELRRRALATTRNHRLGFTFRPDGRPTLRLPFVFLIIAVLATLTSLFAVIRAAPGRQQGPRSTTSDASASAPAATPGETTGEGRTLPALDLADENGELVSLRSLLPVVIVLVDGCECADVVEAAAAAAPQQVTVVALATRAPSPARVPTMATARVRTLSDPTGELRSFLKADRHSGAATAVLADRHAKIVRVVPAVRSVDDYRADLPRLVSP